MVRCRDSGQEADEVQVQDDAALIEEVREIMATTFGLDASELPDDVSQETCDRWSSLDHMTLLVGLEEHFGLSFTMDEMTDMTSVPRIVRVLQGRGVPVGR